MRFSFAIMLLIPCVADAEVYNCGNKWSTQPCKGASKIIPIEPRTAQQEKEKFLRRVRQESMQLYGVQNELDELDRFCRPEETPLIYCLELYNVNLKPKIESYVARRQQERDGDEDTRRNFATQLRREREEEREQKKKENQLLEEENTIEEGFCRLRLPSRRRNQPE